MEIPPPPQFWGFFAFFRLFIAKHRPNVKENSVIQRYTEKYERVSETDNLFENKLSLDEYCIVDTNAKKILFQN